ncbi:putative RNA methyltransferase [Glaciecola sp. SC05]|uniref:putative RNA methyltransferase n=1 Tax=Glaciecola sp. SC05 TaxID=1987355 RepID=UPI003528BFAF
MDHSSAIEKANGVLPFVSWQCPVCHALLELQGRTWQCQQHHGFDCAKEGYVNLLLAQHKNSKAPGDNKDMVLARQDFLATQSYLPLAEALAKITLSHLQQQTNTQDNSARPLLFDVGCSEGYYSAHIQDKLVAAGIDLSVAGLDISKPAVQKAAKKNKQNQYAVASSYNIPLAAKSVDVALQVFAPSSPSEVQRIIGAQGMWLVVEPAANHLQELKEFVYDEAKLHESKQALPSGFNLVKQSSLSFNFRLEDPADKLNLLKMTPFYWRISPANKARLLESLDTITADFTIKQFYHDAFEPSRMVSSV